MKGFSLFLKSSHDTTRNSEIPGHGYEHQRCQHQPQKLLLHLVPLSLLISLSHSPITYFHILLASSLVNISCDFFFAMVPVSMFLFTIHKLHLGFLTPRRIAINSRATSQVRGLSWHFHDQRETDLATEDSSN